MTDARSGPAVSRGLRRLVRRSRMAGFGLLFLAGVVLMAVFAPQLTQHHPNSQNIIQRLEAPSKTHWMGTDELGRDVFARIAYGARVSLLVGIAGSLAGVVLGVILGMMTGYFGGAVDHAIMRLIDLMLSFPGFLMAILIVSVLGPGINNLIVALAIWFTPTIARIIRGTVLVLKSQEFVEAARAQGAGAFRIMRVHLLPNSTSPIIVYATLSVANALLVAAGLSFLGLGAQPPTAEWGAMIGSGRQYLRDGVHVTLFPGLAIFFTVLSLNFVGDALRDALDPRLRTMGS